MKNDNITSFLFTEVKNYIVPEIILLFLVFIILYSVILVWLIKLNFKVSDTSKFLTINTELSSIFDEKISPELTKIVHFIEFQKKFQVSQQETFEKLVMKKFDTLNARLDEVFDEVVTQQMARHKLNDLLASKVKSDSE